MRPVHQPTCPAALCDLWAPGWGEPGFPHTDLLLRICAQISCMASSFSVCVCSLLVFYAIHSWVDTMLSTHALPRILLRPTVHCRFLVFDCFLFVCAVFFVCFGFLVFSFVCLLLGGLGSFCLPPGITVNWTTYRSLANAVFCTPLQQKRDDNIALIN